MGGYYGHYTKSFPRSYFVLDFAARPYLLPRFPAQPTLDSSEWVAIQAYYLDNAPERLAEPERPVQPNPQQQFNVRPLYGKLLPEQPKRVTLLTFDTLRREIVTGLARGKQGRLLRLDLLGEVRDKRRFLSPPVGLTDGNPLLIGKLNPNDRRAGQLLTANQDSILLDSLVRPVDALRLDLNQDDKPEWIIAEYGNVTGGLRAYSQTKNGYRAFRTLLPHPGALQLAKADLDQDGKDDLLALFGQGDEGIFVWRSSNDYRQAERLISLPPSYGSSAFRITDFDDDGDLDMLLTNGDNFDYEPIPKPYHGIRYYENDGSGQFTERWFYPLDGAYDLEIADFDGDGDTDVAAIAYFVPPEWRSRRSLIWLERRGTPTEPDFREWNLIVSPDFRPMRLLAADLDDDGDPDLIASNFSEYNPPARPDTATGSPDIPLVLVLENKKR